MTDAGKGPASRLSTEQRAAFDERIRKAANAARSAPGIPRRADSGAAAPLSTAQQRMWLLDQLVPGSSWYNVTRTALVEGPLDAARLAGALDRVVSRHEALRTAIVSRDGQPFQTVSSAASVTLSVLSLESLPEADREAAALAAALEDAEKPFDLAEPPLLRALLLRLSSRRHVFHLTAHHIVTDGWSMELLFREISALYEANASASVPSLERQYADFCIWQRGWLESDRARAQMTHWADRLRGGAPLALPIDRVRPAVRTSKGVHRTRVLPRPVLDRLGELARSESATLFMLLLAAFDVLLQRHTGQDDISVATPIAGRTIPAVEPLIGFFANTLVLRSDLSGRPTFRELLRRVRETALDSYAHQDVPLEKLVEMLRPDRHLAQNPLAQALFVLQNSPSSALRLSGARVTPIELITRTARFDLELHARETEAGLSCMLIASSDLFDDDAPDRFLDRLEVLVSSILANPNLSIGELPLLPDWERNRVLVEWNQTEQDFGSPRCIHELFEAQAARTPRGIAVRGKTEELTYEELNARANRLAHRLRGLGVGPDTLVAVCLDRSANLVVALLAVWKAGGAYVPIDPSYPAERVEYMLEDSAASVVIAAERFRKLVGESRPVLSVSSVEENPPDSHNPSTVAGPENLAYVLYTSGSTGRPKGVAIEHRNTFAFLEWAQTVFGPENLAGVLGSTSVCFDLSVFELFAPLCCGGTVVISEDALELPDLPARNRVSLINTVPSAIAEIIRLKALPESVRTVNLAGEPLPSELAAQVYESGRVDSVYNLYGPTESTTYSTFTRVPRAAGPMTIGRPIANTQVYLLDAFLVPVPIGVAGELFIGGAGVARGYLHRPELTAEKFLPDPFRPGGGRLYRTGDLARYRNDGEIEYLGRRDGQVKIRGFRIETGEVESQIRCFPGVRDAVVTAHPEGPGNLRLVAYVVPETETEVSIPELRRALKLRLPSPMIPAAFVSLEALPLTPNGKVDRLALPAPGRARPKLSDSYAPPRDEVESALVAIWVGLLGVETVGVHDDFFDLGGHSLLATRLISRIRDQFAVELPLQLLFQFPTVAELAKRLSQAPAAAASTPIERLDRPSRAGASETKMTLDESTHRE